MWSRSLLALVVVAGLVHFPTTEAGAQKIPVLGYMANENVNPERLAIFKKGLVGLGYVEDKTNFYPFGSCFMGMGQSWGFVLAILNGEMPQSGRFLERLSQRWIAAGRWWHPENGKWHSGRKIMPSVGSTTAPLEPFTEASSLITRHNPGLGIMSQRMQAHPLPDPRRIRRLVE